MRNVCDSKLYFLVVFLLAYNYLPNGSRVGLTSIFDEQYQRAYARRGKQMKKLRQSTVGPVFGSLVQHYGLCRISVLGKSGAYKAMLIAAVAFNLGST